MTELKEEWRDIEDYPNYQVSNLGRVKSLGNDKNRKEKILKGGKNIWGYLYVSLWKEGKGKNYTIHKLVAQSFLDNPNNLLEINHIDEDKTNNCVENLEYCDRSYNNNFGTRNKRASASCRKPILQFSKEGEFIKKWNSIVEVKKDLGFNQSNISSCCRGRYKTAYGFIWKYKDVNNCKLCA